MVSCRSEGQVPIVGCSSSGASAKTVTQRGRYRRDVGDTLINACVTLWKVLRKYCLIFCVQILRATRRHAGLLRLRCYATSVNTTRARWLGGMYIPRSLQHPSLNLLCRKSRRRCTASWRFKNLCLSKTHRTSVRCSVPRSSASYQRPETIACAKLRFISSASL